MSQHFHAIVWIDHHEAKVFRFDATDVTKFVVHPSDPHVHLHHKANTIGSGHAPIDREFFRCVIDSLAGAGEIMIVGPASAKTELAAFIAAQVPVLSSRIVTVEAVDHPSDGALVAQARQYFRTSHRTSHLM